MSVQKQSIYETPLNNTSYYLSPTLPDRIQKRFIVKVYSILWVQILFTSCFIGLCNVNHDVAMFITSQMGQAISVIFAVAMFTELLMLYCLYDTFKQSPFNWIILVSFTIMMTYLLGIVGVVYSSEKLLLGGSTTLTIFTGLSLYAWQSTIDYTVFGNVLTVILFGFIMMGILMSFVNVPFVNTIYSVFGAMLFSFYIIYDTQMIMGGRHKKFSFTVDDFVIASISLYLDIINLFLYIMEILDGNSR